MATLSARALTLADWAKRLDPDGATADIVEILAQENEMLDDMVFIEANEVTGHRTTIRTGLPTVYWRMLNQGTLDSKSTTRQKTEPCAMLDAWGRTDVELVKLAKDPGAFRLSESSAFIEAMSQEHQDTVLYGSAANPEEFVGFSNLYNSSSGDNGQNIILGGGAGADNTSLWLIGWGERTVHGIFPRGSMAGIQHEDLGIETVENAGGVTGALMRAYTDHYMLKTGLSVRDWRYVVRIPNLDVSDMQAGNVNLLELMVKALHRLPSLRNCRPVFYCNRTVRQYLDIQAMNKANVFLTVGEEEGRMKTMLRGVPIRTVDKLVNNETLVS